MVKQGFMAAAAIQPLQLPVRIYSSSDRPDDIVSAYRQATQAGARLVVGPLTRSGVSALVATKAVNVPTLALNLPEQDSDLPPTLYLFGLSADSEARQAAKMAFADGRRTAVVIASGGALSKRIQQAFTAAWALQGGSVTAQLTFNGANAETVRDELARHTPDMLFLALTGPEVRLLRPYLGAAVPTYATSQVYGGRNNPQRYFDLNGIRFVDMPWLLQPDHAAVMIYPRPSPPVPADLERLYALGIDAWRLAVLLMVPAPGTTLSLDGVTGQITLTAHQFQRTGVGAEFRDGEAALLAP